MADLLGEVDVNIASRLPLKTVKTAARRKTRVLSPPITQSRNASRNKSSMSTHGSHLPTTPPPEAADEDKMALDDGLDDEDFMLNDEASSSPLGQAVERKIQLPTKIEDEEDDTMEVTQVVGDYSVKSANINISGARPAPKIVKTPPYPSPESSSPTRPPSDAVDPASWNEVTSKLNVLSSQGPESTSQDKLRVEDVAEEDGSVRMFWTDYTEVNGSLCLFGKVKDKKTGSYASAFAKVDNILRKLYFLPRTYRQRE